MTAFNQTQYIWVHINKKKWGVSPYWSCLTKTHQNLSEAMIRNIISTLLTKEISSKCGVQPEVDGYTWNNNI